MIVCLYSRYYVDIKNDDILQYLVTWKGIFIIGCQEDTVQNKCIG